MAEQMPPAVRDILVERGGHHRGADVAGAAADQCGLRNPAQLVRVLKVFQAAERLILIRPPAIEIGLGARTLGTTDTFGRVLIDTDHKLLEVMVVGPQVVGIVPAASGFGPADGFLVFGRQVFDEPVLLTRPEAAGGMTGRKDERLDALGLVVDDIRNGLHGSPRLAEDVKGVEVKIVADGDEFVDPGLLRPQFGMTVEIGIATAYLVVGDDLPPRVGDAIEHLEIVVRAARPTVEQQQRGFLTGLTHNAVVGVVSHKRHIAFCNYVVHDDDGFKMLIEFLISGTKIRISKEKAKSFLSY